MTYVPKQVDVNYLSGALLSDCISFWLLIDFLRLISCSPFKSISDTRRLLFLKIPKTCHCHLCTKFTKGVKTETNGFFFFFQNDDAFDVAQLQIFLSIAQTTQPAATVSMMFLRHAGAVNSSISILITSIATGSSFVNVCIILK